MQIVMENFISALPAITAGIVLAVLGWGVPKFSRAIKSFSNFKNEHEDLLELKDNADKAHEDLHAEFIQYKKEEDEKFQKYHAAIQEELNEYKQNNREEFTNYQTRISTIVEELEHNQKIFNDSQRTQIKWQIVDIYQNAKSREGGYITPLELDIVNRLYENYVDLNGNTYIEAIVSRCNHKLPISGEDIPEHN